MRIQLPYALLVAIFACSMHAAPAQAQRVFVSATGSDGNPCSFASPCRTFQHAHDTAPANGEIDVLDPAGYGPLTITKAISIQGHGFSGISAINGATAITINAGASDAVSLRGLLIDGAGTGSSGIQYNTAANVTIADCVIRNFTSNGIWITTGNVVPGAPLPTFTVSNTTTTNNGFGGVVIQPSGSQPIVHGFLSNVATNNNQYGVYAFGAAALTGGDIQIQFVDGVAFNNLNTDILAQTLGSQTSVGIVVRNSMIVGEVETSSDTARGVVADGPGAAVAIHHSSIPGHNFGFVSFNSGVLASSGDNYIGGKVDTVLVLVPH